MSRHSVIDRLQGANERLRAALIAGEDTLPHRNAIERLGADLVKLEEAERRAESVAIAKAAADQAERTELIAHSVTGDITATMARHPIPNTNFLENNMTSTDPAVVSATNALAAAQSKYAAAELAYKEAEGHTAGLRSRLGDLENTAKSISDQRRSGQLNDREAGGMLSLNLEDQADLKQLLAAAEQKMQSLTPNHGAVNHAAEGLERQKKFVLFQQLAKRSQEIESAFLNVVADLYETGLAIGNNPMLGSSWIASRELTEMLHFGVPPTKAQ